MTSSQNKRTASQAGSSDFSGPPSKVGTVPMVTKISCFYDMCSLAGVEVPFGVTRVADLDEDAMSALAAKRQFKVLLRAYSSINDPRNHVELVRNDATNFKSYIRGPFDLEQDFYYLVCTSTLHFFNKGNEWSKFHFFSSIPFNQFFKPTRFQSIADKRRLSFPSAGNVATTYVRNIQEAESFCGENQRPGHVFGLTAEPGSGKTTVLPFSFTSSKVAVVLPTGFDAWSAFKTASDVANLMTLSKVIKNGSHVTYFDSYSMASTMYDSAGKIDFDIVIIDESDSNAGITKALTEMKVPSVAVIHLSGTSNESSVRSNGSFPIEKSYNFPKLSNEFFDAVEYIKENSLNLRSLVMCPDHKIASQIHKMLYNSQLISEQSSYEQLEDIFENQQSNALIVCDESCTRGFNLNLDAVFDFQIVGSSDYRRVITSHEETQRMMRVGRNKSGVYHCPKQVLGVVSHSELDVFRNNVARYLFSLPLKQCSLVVDSSNVYKLAVSVIEPFKQQLLTGSNTPLSSDSSIEPKSRSPSSTKSVSASTRTSTSVKSVPAFAAWTMGFYDRRSSSSSSTSSAVIVSESDSDGSKRRAFVRSSPMAPARINTSKGLSKTERYTAELPSRKKLAVTMPTRPPPIDLTLEHDYVDWPAALAAQLEAGELTPFIIPYDGWAYTSDGAASGVDYLQKLSGIIREGPSFSKPEFEVVCRSWNLLSARGGFSFAKRKDAWNDSAYFTFCVEYFNSYLSIL
uniref:P3 n=1 Tax=Grapevine associated jivivirus 2 TaxID=2716189 RepID=A0A6G7M4Z7_9VIRU|nr:P3 [Grapevine associated jivivirus 2]